MCSVSSSHLLDLATVGVALSHDADAYAAALCGLSIVGVERLYAVSELRAICAISAMIDVATHAADGESAMQALALAIERHREGLSTLLGGSFPLALMSSDIADAIGVPRDVRSYAEARHQVYSLDRLRVRTRSHLERAFDLCDQCVRGLAWCADVRSL